MRCPIGHCPNERSLSERPELFKTHMEAWHTKAELGNAFLNLSKFWNEHNGKETKETDS